MMQKSSTLLNKKIPTGSQSNRSSDQVFDRVISAILLFVLSPVHILNAFLAVIQHKPIFHHIFKQDCLHRPIDIIHFNYGMIKNTGAFWTVLMGKVSLCGMPTSISLTESQKRQLSRFHHVQAGLFDAVSVRTASGLTTKYPARLLKKQFLGNRRNNLSLLIRGLISWLVFHRQDIQLDTPDTFSLFGLQINNDSMSSAIRWTLSSSRDKESQGCKVGFFINVNSVNLSAKDAKLTKQINRANRNFADGLGMRMAARKSGFCIKENVNGTDMLPRLCESAAQTGRSIFLLGAKPGIADSAAKNLRSTYPTLKISGTAHGYFREDQSEAIVDQINKTKTNILLVAMGSPIQERWLLDNMTKLNCDTALAVGGLLDFSAGIIPRSPMWLRELGMEWIWRLMQEPKTKFKRYVIGTPLFLIRTFIFNQANKGR